MARRQLCPVKINHKMSSTHTKCTSLTALKDDEMALIYSRLSLLSIVAMVQTCKVFKMQIYLPEFKAKHLLKVLTRARILNSGLFIKDTESSFETTTQGFSCMAVGYAHIQISGQLHTSTGYRSEVYVSPKIAANAFQDDWLPQLQQMQDKCSLLLRNMALVEVKMSEYNGAMGNGVVWYRQFVPLKVVYQSDTGVTFIAKGDIYTPPSSVIGDAFEKDEKTFKDLHTHINWSDFRMECK